MTSSETTLMEGFGRKLVFASPGPAQSAAEARRFALWWEEYEAAFPGQDVAPCRDAPFAIDIEFAVLGGVGLGRGKGSAICVERRRAHVSRDTDDRFMVVINRGPGDSQVGLRARSVTLAPGAAVMADLTEPGSRVYPRGYSSDAVLIPRQMMLAALPNAAALVGLAAPADNEALRLLGRYAAGLFAESPSGSAVLAHAGQTLVDLVALAFGAEGDRAEAARLGGLRAARLALVLRHIRAEFADPQLSPTTVAAQVGISPSYLHRLLQHTGSSFGERVQELRLDHAYRLLRGDPGPMRRVSDAAYTAGFSDLSHFNRSFHRKYGLTPTAARRAPRARAGH